MTSEEPRPAAGRRPAKSAAAFRTISEVAAELDVPTHVLRFWEGKFPNIRPLKRGGGRRYYRPEDVELLRRIRRLLYEEGYTIKGAQRLVRETGGRGGDAGIEGPALAAENGNGEEHALAEEARQELGDLLGELRRLRELLDRALS